MNNMTNVPTKFPTLVLSQATEMSKTTLAVVRLNSTSTKRNFQNVDTDGTRPTRPYTIPPNRSGGTTRSGRMSKRTFEEKYVNDE